MCIKDEFQSSTNILLIIWYFICESKNCCIFSFQLLHLTIIKFNFMQDQIEFLLCDYRKLPSNKKYDRIISWSEPVICLIQDVTLFTIIYIYIWVNCRSGPMWIYLHENGHIFNKNGSIGFHRKKKKEFLGSNSFFF